MRHLWPAILLFVVLLASSACFAPDTVSAIGSFTAERDKVTKGQPAKLTAVFEGSGTIDNGVGEVTSGMPVTTMPLTANTKFTLTVLTDGGDPSTETLEIGAVDPAVIKSFKAEKVILPGQEGKLIADFTGTGEVDMGVGPIKSGELKSVGIVAATKVFTLTAKNEIGDPVTATAEVEAAITPVITSFTAPGEVVGRYVPTELTAVFIGGKGVVDQDVGAIVSNMPVKTKDVPAAGATYTLTVTNGLGEKVTKTVSVKTKKELFVTDNVQDVLVFDIDQSGDVEPKRIVVTEIAYTGTLGLAIFGEELFVSNEAFPPATGTPAISAYNLFDGFRPPYKDGGGDTKVKRRITGPATTMNAAAMPATGAQQFAVANGEIFVADKSSTIKVWNVNDNGNVAPKRTISGALTKLNNCLGVWVDGNELYVGNLADGGTEGSVTVYPITASGNVAPTRTITGTLNVSGLEVSGNELFVFALNGGGVTVYDKTSGAQLRKIAGAATQMDNIYQCAIADGELFCSSYSKDRIVIFPANGNGNIAPTRQIMGDKTYVAAPTGAFVF